MKFNFTNLLNLIVSNNALRFIKESVLKLLTLAIEYYLQFADTIKSMKFIQLKSNLPKIKKQKKKKIKRSTILNLKSIGYICKG